MVYEAPDSNNVDFELQDYDAPDADNVNFQFDDVVQREFTPQRFTAAQTQSTTNDYQTDGDSHTLGSVVASVASLAAQDSSYLSADLQATIDEFFYADPFSAGFGIASTEDSGIQRSKYRIAEPTATASSLGGLESIVHQLQESTVTPTVFGYDSNPETKTAAFESAETVDWDFRYTRFRSYQVLSPRWVTGEANAAATAPSSTEKGEHDLAEDSAETFDLFRPRPKYGAGEADGDVFDLFRPRPEYLIGDVSVLVGLLSKTPARYSQTEILFDVLNLKEPPTKRLPEARAPINFPELYTQDERVTIAEALLDIADLDDEQDTNTGGFATSTATSFSPEPDSQEISPSILTADVLDDVAQENLIASAGLSTQGLWSQNSEYPIALALVDPLKGRYINASLHWIIEGYPIIELVEETRTWDQLSLQFRIRKSYLTSFLRPNINEAGKVDTTERIDGGFDAVGRAGIETLLSAEAPVERSKVRSVGDYYVDSYNEEPVDSRAESWEVELDLIPKKEKAYDNEYGTLTDPVSETRPEGYWKFEFDFGDIVTRRVTTDVTKTPQDTFENAEVEIIMTPEEVRVLEESAGRLGAINVREVPDGSNIIEDNTGGRNRVTITPPEEAEKTIEPGDYILREFETFYNLSVYTVTFEVTEA